MNLPTNKATMSSREIAKLTGKNHKNILRDCDKLNANYQKMNMAQISAMEEDHPQIAGRKVRYYQLTRMQTFDLVTGYNTELRIKVNRRWEELETSNLTQFNQLAASMAQIAVGVAKVAKSQEALVNLTTNHSERLERLEKQQYTDKPAKSTTFTPEVIDARDQEYDFAKINGCNVRRIIVNERVNYSINDILQAIGVTTNSGQVAKKLYRNAPHTVVKIHIFGNTHPAWFCTKKGIELIKSGSRKLNGKKVKCELN